MSAVGEQQYLDLLAEVLAQGAGKSDRTGTGTLSVFGRQMRFGLRDSFPLLTTKKLHVKSIVYELLWFLRGETNVKWLQERGVSIWDEWADASGELGPVYGYQWRHWKTPDGREIDQISQLVDNIRTRPDSRRLAEAAGGLHFAGASSHPALHGGLQCPGGQRRVGGRRRDLRDPRVEEGEASEQRGEDFRYEQPQRTLHLDSSSADFRSLPHSYVPERDG